MHAHTQAHTHTHTHTHAHVHTCTHTHAHTHPNSNTHTHTHMHTHKHTNTHTHKKPAYVTSKSGFESPSCLIRVEWFGRCILDAKVGWRDNTHKLGVLHMVIWRY